MLIQICKTTFFVWKVFPEQCSFMAPSHSSFIAYIQCMTFTQYMKPSEFDISTFSGSQGQFWKQEFGIAASGGRGTYIQYFIIDRKSYPILPCMLQNCNGILSEVLSCQVKKYFVCHDIILYHDWLGRTTWSWYYCMHHASFCWTTRIIFATSIRPKLSPSSVLFSLS